LFLNAKKGRQERKKGKEKITILCDCASRHG